jgi:hypothetical protein
MNSLVNLLPYIIPRLEVVWGKPTTDAIGLQICMEAFGNAFIGTGITEKTRIVLDRMHHCGAIKMVVLQKISSRENEAGNYGTRIIVAEKMCIFCIFY